MDKKIVSNHSTFNPKPFMGFYIHIPFCEKRCNYCDFNTSAGMAHVMGEYVDSLKKEIKILRRRYADQFRIGSIYFGGGTPNMLSTDMVKSLVECAYSSFNVCGDAEITCECNPNALQKNYLTNLRSNGVNRLSIGMQSANKHVLTLLGRLHSFSESMDAVLHAKQSGFDNINMDIIYGIPNQSLQDFQNTLQKARDLDVQHLSLYSLSVHAATPIAAMIADGRIPAVDDDIAADMYEWADCYLRQSGFSQYEISNWSKTDRTTSYKSIHNLSTWRHQPYMGIGAGAHSYDGVRRWENIPQILDYIDSVQVDSVEKIIPHQAIINYRYLSNEEQVGEAMMMGLRLTDEGVNLENVAAAYAIDVHEVYGEKIQKLVEKGLLEVFKRNGQTVIRLTQKGRILGNLVFMEFI